MLSPEDSNYEAALFYRGENLSIVPLMPGKKKPLLPWKGNQHRPLTDTETESLFRGKILNIGIIGGTVSGNFAAIDVDDPDLFHEKASKALKELRANTVVVTTSRRPGKRRPNEHVYIRTPAPVRSFKIPEIGSEIIAENKYIVAPNSIGPNGQYYFNFDSDYTRKYFEIANIGLNDFPDFVLEPIESPQDFDHNCPKAGTCDHQGLSPFGMIWRDWDCLTNGNYEKYGFTKGHPGNKSRSEMDFQSMLFRVNDGWTLEQNIELHISFAHPATKFGEKYRENKRHAIDYVKITYHNAVKHVSMQKSELKERLSALETCVDENEFFSEIKPAEKEIFGSLVRIARRTNSPEIGVSVREAAEYSGTNYKTAHKYLKSLINRNLVSLTGKASRRKSNVYEINLDFAPEDCKPLAFERTPNFREKDVFRHNGGIGKTGFTVFKVIYMNPGVTASEIIVKSFLKRSSVYEKIKLMNQVGIIEKINGGWRARPDHLDDAAVKLGTDGTLNRERRKHAWERKRHYEAIGESFRAKQGT